MDTGKKEFGTLSWHYGPTEQNKDPGRMWCYDCGGEVWWLKDDDEGGGGFICTKCSKTSED